MREHQIVINLKTEHFEEAQRLARQAGAKSASAFLRDKLVDLLEFESGQANPDNQFSQAKQERLARLSRDLTRMHRELQVYVAESWHETDQIAEKSEATGKSPTSDAVASISNPEEPINFEAALQAIDSMDLFGAKFGANKEAQTTGGADSSLSATLLQTQAGYEKAADFAQRFQNSGIPISESNNVPTPTNQSEDDLEELADRAFAISPRLGAIEDPDAGPLLEEDDPLKDLLDDTLVKKMGHRAPGRRAKSDEHSRSRQKSPDTPSIAKPDIATETPAPDKAAQQNSQTSLSDLENLLEPGKGAKPESISALEEMLKQTPQEESNPEELVESNPDKESAAEIEWQLNDEPATVHEEPVSISEEEEVQHEDDDDDKREDETSSNEQAGADETAARNDEGENTIDHKSAIRHDLTSGPPPKRRKRTP